MKSDTDGDHIPDGAEKRLGTDLHQRDPITLVQTKGPFVDGQSDEWEFLPATVVRPTKPWFYLPAANGVQPLPGLHSAMAEVFEIEIPLKGFSGHSFQILPILMISKKQIWQNGLDGFGLIFLNKTG